METLLLVDGSSYLYRAFHALPDFRNRNNEPTGAVYGVLNMLRRLHKDYQADYSACVFDAKGKTFRDDLYAQYKSHRPPMPDDLAAQIDPLNECIKAMGWPMLVVEGVEADDVIGSLVKQAEHQNMNCIISTGDKDIAQLVTPQVTLVNTMTNERLDEAAVLTKFGVTPARMLDYLALVGDTADGYPGIEGIGKVGAARLVERYGTIEAFPETVLGENRELALLFKRLATLRTDAPLFNEVESLRWQGPRESFAEHPAIKGNEKLIARAAKTFAKIQSSEPNLAS